MTVHSVGKQYSLDEMVKPRTNTSRADAAECRDIDYFAWRREEGFVDINQVPIPGEWTGSTELEGFIAWIQEC